MWKQELLVATDWNWRHGTVFSTIPTHHPPPTWRLPISTKTIDENTQSAYVKRWRKAGRTSGLEWQMERVKSISDPSLIHL